MSILVRLRSPDGPLWAVDRDGELSALGTGLADLLSLPLADARAVVERAGDRLEGADRWPRLAPVDEQEVWACGVTYERSREGREEESASAALYTAVYEADRPEIFFKAVPWRVVGDGDAIGIRRDSTWDVPEAELGLVVSQAGEIVGYVAGNDMSSRSIEGANPLYLPQAKVYDRSCALGPGIVPAWEVEPPFDITLRVTRDGRDAYAGRTSTTALRRRLDDLVGWAVRATTFPHGLVLLTGTGLVPERDFTLCAGDVVTIDVAGVGTLCNPVVEVGR